MDAYISSQKIDLIHWITELNDISVLAQVNAIKDDVLPLSYAEMQSIERGLNDFQRGNTISHTHAKKRYEKWL
jgi:vacuolar-type H+-ATPase subunit D/Vma8